MLPLPWETLAALPLWIAALIVAVDAALKIIALGALPENRRPSSAVSWLLLIFWIPVLGWAMFLLFGSTKLNRRREELSREINAYVLGRSRDVEQSRAVLEGEPDWLRNVTRLGLNLGTLPVVGGNSVELLPDYRDTIRHIAESIESATRYVHVQFYIASWDEVTHPVFEAMARAAERGVVVRFLYDDLGTRRTAGFRDLTARLARTRIQASPMLPINVFRGRFRRPDLRNHRKIVVVDGSTAYTGSLNLVEPGYRRKKSHELGREWVELMTKLHGDVVYELNLVFATDWYTETGELIAEDFEIGDQAGESRDLARQARDDAPRVDVGEVACQILPSGPGFPSENNLRVFTTLIYSAQHKLVICSPYFVPDESLLAAITTATQRGVSVELFVSTEADQFLVDHSQKSYYRALLEAGVVIYQYRRPFILHSKHLSVDNEVVVIGSSNMDMRSFQLNAEVSMIAFDGRVVHDLHRVEALYRQHSTILTKEQWARRPLASRWLDNVARLTSAFL